MSDLNKQLYESQQIIQEQAKLIEALEMELKAVRRLNSQESRRLCKDLEKRANVLELEKKVLRSENEDMLSKINFIEEELGNIENQGDFKKSQLQAYAQQLKKRLHKKEKDLRKLRRSRGSDLPEKFQTLDKENQCLKQKGRPKSALTTRRKSPSTIENVKKELGLGSTDEVLPALKSYKLSLNFIQKLKKLVGECAGTPRDMSIHSLWKWIRRLLEEYSKQSTERNLVYMLKSALGVKDSRQIPNAFHKLLKEHEALLNVLSNIKNLSRKPNKNTIRKIQEELCNL